MKKRIWAGILAFCMMLTMLPLSAAAAEVTPQSNDFVLKNGENVVENKTVTVTYTGSAVRGLTVAKAESSGLKGAVALKYQKNAETATETAPTDVGEYKIIAVYTPGEDETLAENKASAEVELGTLTITKAEQTFTATAASSSIAAEGTTTITVTGTAYGNVTATSNVASVATVEVKDNTITVTGVAEGTAKITVTAAGNDNYKAGSAEVEITVTAKPVEKGTLTKDDFTFTSPSLTYTGSTLTLPANMIVAKGDAAGKIGAITTEIYSSSAKVTDLKNAGEYTVKINVAASDNYNAATALTDSSWKFTVAKATATATVTISGTAKVGETLTANVTLPSLLTGSTPTYEWSRKSGETTTKISGATSTTYKVTKDDVGKTLSVTATITNANVTCAPATSAQTAAVPKIQLSGTVAVATNGENGATGTGAKLTATITLGDGATESDVDIKWQADGTDIADATGKEYTITEGDADKTLTCVVTAKESGSYTGSIASSGIKAGTTMLSGSLTITGDTTVGSKLTASPIEGKTLGTDYTLQWYRDSEAISGATGAEYTIANADRGHTVTVKATGTGTYTGEIAATGKAVVATKPAKITGVTATPGDGQVALTWVAPDNGGAAITGYTVTYAPAGGESKTATATTTSCTVTGLTNDTEYSFTVTATNSAGLSDASDAVKATPKAGGSGSGSGSGSSSTTPTPTPPSQVTTEVKPTVVGGTASADVSTGAANTLVENAKSEGAAQATVKVEPSGSADSVEVSLPAAAVGSLGSETKADLNVETPVANVTIPNESLGQLGQGSEKVTVSATKNADSSVSVTVKKDGAVVNTLSQPMKAEIPAPNATSTTVAVLVKADGTETILGKSIAEDGSMSMILDGSATVKIKDNAKSFNDTANHWADEKGAISFVTSRELFKGVSSTSFAPEQSMNRAMLVTVLHRLESTPKGGSVSFGDVDSKQYYAEAVAWGTQKGIVKGVSDTSFAPNDNISREQLATLLYRYAGAYGIDTTGRAGLSSFGDSGKVSGYAEEALEWCVSVGLIQGEDNGNLNPKGNAKRCEVAVILMRFVEHINK